MSFHLYFTVDVDKQQTSNTFCITLRKGGLNAPNFEILERMFWFIDRVRVEKIRQRKPIHQISPCLSSPI